MLKKKKKFAKPAIEQLFKSKQRTRTEPKKPGEGEFAFYNSSSRPEFEIYRTLLNAWISELPANVRAEIVPRMQKGDNLGYQAALAELTIHAALIRQGYTVEVHPTCGHPTYRPDFLVRTKEDGYVVAFVEVTTFGPAEEHVSQSKREADIYNAIDRAKMPAGFRLGYDVVDYGKKTPKLTQLVGAIESWAAANTQDKAVIPPTRVFESDDWKIELKLFAGFKKDVVPTRAIAAAMGDVRIAEPRLEIRDALETKGKRYGVFEAPYVIVMADCKGELVGGDHNMEALNEALFGSIGFQMTAYADGTHKAEQIRNADGYWWNGEKAIHANVSAAVLLPRPHLWDLRNERWQPIILRNPWATYPLDESRLPLPGGRYNLENQKFENIEGTRLADMLQLPAVWPPEVA